MRERDEKHPARPLLGDRQLVGERKPTGLAANRKRVLRFTPVRTFLPQAAHLQAGRRYGPLSLPVPVRRPGHRPPEPGVGHP